MLSCQNKSISKNKGWKKLFLSYLVHFHCAQSILGNFLMSDGSSNHSTFYHENNGTVFKIKFWFRRKSKSLPHKELLHLSINMPMKQCTPKISRILKKWRFYGFQDRRITLVGTKLAELLKLSFYWICLSWLVHFLLSCTKPFRTEKPHRGESLEVLKLLWNHQSQ